MVKKAAALFALGLALVSNAPVASAQLACFGDVDAVRVQREQALTNVTLAARAAGLGTPLSGTVRLCNAGGLFVWEFTELGNDGRTQRRVLNAATGGIVPGL